MKESKYLSIDHIMDVLINFKTKYKWIKSVGPRDLVIDINQLKTSTYLL
jgi:hypothetical protein